MYAYSDELDSYSGWCGYGGLAAQDSFYNDDGTFYVTHDIISKNNSGSMGIGAQRSTWSGWRTETARFASSVGNHKFTFEVPKGKYRLYFYSSNDARYTQFQFKGKVYDNN